MSQVETKKQISTEGPKFNTRTDLNRIMEMIKEYVGGDAIVDGCEVPRFGLLSILARRTPMYVYDNPFIVDMCPTAFTDGIHVFFCADFLDKLLDEDEEAKSKGADQSSAIFVVLHEFMHIIGRHHERLRSYDPMLANIATDISINTRLRQGFENVKPGDTPKLGWGMKDGDIEKYAHMSEESIARLLIEEWEKQAQQQSGDGDGNDQDGNQQGGSSKGKGGMPSQGQGQSGSGKGGQKPKGGSQKGDGAPEGGSMAGDGEYENHMPTLQDFYDKLTEAGLDYVKDLLELPQNREEAKEAIEALNDEQKLKLIDDIQKAVSQKNSVGGKYPGGHIVDAAAEMVGKLARPKMKWKAAIRDMIIGQGMCYDVSPDEPGDLYYVDSGDMGLTDEVYVPSSIPSRPNDVILAMVDTSGSVDKKMLKDFFSEIFGIVKSEGDNIGEVIALSADTVCRGEPIIINEDTYEAAISNVVAFGRGGTDFNTSICHALDMDLIKDKKVSGLVYFTDLYDTPPQRQNLPEELPPILFVTPPGYKQEAFANAVQAFADVVEIEDGKTVDMDEVRERKQRTNSLSR